MIHSDYERDPENGEYRGFNAYSIYDAADLLVFDYHEETVDRIDVPAVESAEEPVFKIEPNTRGTESPKHDARRPPSINLHADPVIVAYGESTMLRWDSRRANRCSASGAWTGSRPAKGAEDSGPLTSTSKFSLTCFGLGGRKTKSVIVKVKEKPKDWNDPSIIDEFRKRKEEAWKKEQENWEQFEGEESTVGEAARQKIRDNKIRIAKRVADAKRLQLLLAPGKNVRDKYLRLVRRSIEEKKKKNRLVHRESQVLKAIEENDVLRSIELIHEMLGIIIMRNEGLLPSQLVKICRRRQISCAFPHLTVIYSEKDINNIIHQKY